MQCLRRIHANSYLLSCGLSCPHSSLALQVWKRKVQRVLEVIVYRPDLHKGEVSIDLQSLKWVLGYSYIPTWPYTAPYWLFHCSTHSKAALRSLAAAPAGAGSGVSGLCPTTSGSSWLKSPRTKSLNCLLRVKSSSQNLSAWRRICSQTARQHPQHSTARMLQSFTSTQLGLQHLSVRLLQSCQYDFVCGGECRLRGASQSLHLPKCEFVHALVSPVCACLYQLCQATHQNGGDHLSEAPAICTSDPVCSCLFS